MMLSLRSTMIAILVGVSASFARAEGGPKTNDVLVAFQRQAMVIAAAQTNGHTKAFLNGKIQDTVHLSVQASTFSNAFRRIEGTLSPTERRALILKGAIPALARPGECWIVESLGGVGNEISCYLDLNSKEVVLFWIVPEG